MRQEFQKYAPVLLRVTLGIAVFAWGFQKFMNPAIAAQAIPAKILFYLPLPPTATAYGGGIIEVILGVLLVLGLGTRNVATLVTGLIIGSMFSGDLFTNMQKGITLGSSVALILTGASCWSIDGSRDAGKTKKKAKNEEEIILGEDTSVF